MKFYFVIPTINGEINGEPYIIFNLDIASRLSYEVTIYEISFEFNYISTKEIK